MARHGWLRTMAATGSTASDAALPVYLDTQYSSEERAANLVSRMTLPEKVAQLSTNSGPAIPRPGVQQYTYWSEGQHGVNSLGAKQNNNGNGGPPKATSFPANFASSMSWDPNLLYQETTTISHEARGFLSSDVRETASTTPYPGGDVAVTAAYGNTSSGPTPWKATVSYDSAAPQPGRTVASVTLPDGNSSPLHVFAAAIG